MRISDWSSDVCSSDLVENRGLHEARVNRVDPDAFARIRQRGRTGESGDGMLGRHVGGAQGLADQAKDGRGVDDRAAACGPELRDLITKGIGHTWCRERVCQSVIVTGGGWLSTKKKR